MNTKAICALVLAVSFPACAQKSHKAAPAAASAPAPEEQPAPPPGPANIQKFDFHGAGNFSQADLASAAGVAPGTMTPDQIQKAADTLSATGQFADVSFKVDGNTLVFELKPQPAYLAAHFENFAWYTDAELLRAAHAKAPLFYGTFGGKGTVYEQVQSALTELAQKAAGPRSNVEYAVINGADGSPVAVAFSITGVDLRIGRVRIANTPLETSGATSDIANSMQGQPYNRDANREFLSSRLGQVYSNLGYVDFELKDVHAGEPKPRDGGWDLVLEAEAKPGNQYRVGTITWSGTSELSADDFARIATLHAGDIAERSRLDQTLHSVERAYANRGYINARASANPTINRDKQTVNYSITVEQGTKFATELQ